MGKLNSHVHFVFSIKFMFLSQSICDRVEIIENPQKFMNTTFLYTLFGFNLLKPNVCS